MGDALQPKVERIRVYLYFEGGRGVRCVDLTPEEGNRLLDQVNELRVAVNAALLDGMTRKERDLVVHRMRSGGMRVSDIAWRTGLSTNAVQNAVNRVRYGRYGEELT